MSEPLPPREVHLWWASIARARRHLDALRGLLDEDERQRADRYLVPAAGQRFVVGRALLRTTLGRYLERNPAELRFSYGEHGKPGLEGQEDAPAFNASHSGDLTVVALARTTTLGADVEQLREVARAERLSRRFFTPDEHDAVARSRAGVRSLVFLHIWTCKEALLKALGTGIASGLDSVEVAADPEARPRLLRVPDGGGAAGGWTLLRASPGESSIATVAVRGRGWRLVLREAAPGE